MYKAPVCRAHLMLHGPTISIDEAKRLRKRSAILETQNVRAGFRRAKASAPALQAYGPKLPV
eukprot:9322912-Karenia_brevis.AAC.1